LTFALCAQGFPARFILGVFFIGSLPLCVGTSGVITAEAMEMKDEHALESCSWPL
jgi:hypothetical protein